MLLPRLASLCLRTPPPQACELLWLHAYDYCRLIDTATMAEMKAVAAKFNQMSQFDVANNTAIQAALNGRRMGDNAPDGGGGGGGGAGGGGKAKTRSIKVIKVDRSAGRAAAQRKYDDSGLKDWEPKNGRTPRGGGGGGGSGSSRAAAAVAREESSFLPAIKPGRGCNTVR